MHKKAERSYYKSYTTKCDYVTYKEIIAKSVKVLGQLKYQKLSSIFSQRVKKMP